MGERDLIASDIDAYLARHQRKEILRWTDTPYTFVKQQSDRNPLVWSSLMPPSNESAPTTASHNH